MGRIAVRQDKQDKLIVAVFCPVQRIFVVIMRSNIVKVVNNNSPDKFMYKIKYILVALVGIITLWFVTIGGYELFRYWKLNQSTDAYVESWGTEEVGAKFFPTASYSYQVQGMNYQSTVRFKTLYALNAPSAEANLKQYRLEKWRVWYDPKKPSDSSLERVFPTKSILYALMTLGLFLYFYVILSRSFPEENKK